MSLFDRFRKKKIVSDGSEDKHRARLCFVLSRSMGPYDLSHASSVVSQVFGEGYLAEVSDSIVTVMRGSDTIGFLAHMPMPIPGNEAEENADGNFLWPNGKAEAAMHRSHVVVTNVNANDESPITSAVTVLRLALVALKLFDGLGVYWGNASVSNSRDVFEAFCESISDEHLPVAAILRFQIVKASNDAIGIYTIGMGQFELMDIEVDHCNMEVIELFEFVADIAHYLIQSGPVILDGNTVGGSADERILVRHRPSMIDKKKKVYKIVFEGH